MITKNRLDELAAQYETADFIESDPVKFIHRFSKKEDIEIAGFLSSMFSYGNRKTFLPKLEELFKIMDEQPLNYILKFDETFKDFDNFDYRFSKGCDIKEILLILNKLYKQQNSSLEDLFTYGWQQQKTVKGMLCVVCDYFYSNVSNEVTKGFYHLIPDAHKSSALKRLNMFLRWMIRDGVVDKGIWSFMPKSELIIPLDVHVGKLSVKTGLIAKSNGDFKTAQTITEVLKQFDNNDPIKYDFALFGYGVNNK